MARATEFRRELNKLFARRVGALSVILEKKRSGALPTLKKAHVRKTIKRLQELVSQSLARDLAREEFDHAVHSGNNGTSGAAKAGRIGPEKESLAVGSKKGYRERRASTSYGRRGNACMWGRRRPEKGGLRPTLTRDGSAARRASMFTGPAGGATYRLLSA
jgi:hypothetical protein